MNSKSDKTSKEDYATYKGACFHHEDYAAYPRLALATVETVEADEEYRITGKFICRCGLESIQQ